MKSIMIVEDDEKIVEALTIRLKSAGFRVFSALDPVTGLANIVREQPDLILLDLNMPAGGGFLMAERVLRHPQLNPIPMIVITANKQPEARSKAQELGIDYFIEKPFSSEELLTAVNDLLFSSPATGSGMA
ncbi:MAG: response regulator transcription factor [Legionellales bacterium]|nr:response regulator transcription factor [Legionellales bacterium]